MVLFVLVYKSDAVSIALNAVATLVFVLPWQILELSRPRNMALQVESAEDV